MAKTMPIYDINGDNNLDLDLSADFFSRYLSSLEPYYESMDDISLFGLPTTVSANLVTNGQFESLPSPAARSPHQPLPSFNTFGDTSQAFEASVRDPTHPYQSNEPPMNGYESDWLPPPTPPIGFSLSDQYLQPQYYGNSQSSMVSVDQSIQSTTSSVQWTQPIIRPLQVEVRPQSVNCQIVSDPNINRRTPKPVPIAPKPAPVGGLLMTVPPNLGHTYGSVSKPSMTPTINGTLVDTHTLLSDNQKICQISSAATVDPQNCTQIPVTVGELQIREMSGVDPIVSQQSEVSVTDDKMSTIGQQMVVSSQQTMVTNQQMGSLSKQIRNRQTIISVTWYERQAIRRERNRKAAKKCREKKLATIARLEHRQHQLRSDNLQLENYIDFMRKTLIDLKCRLIEHKFEDNCHLRQRALIN